jgi:pyruvate/2-oxoglutarate dehydrogenase complex dihydrolipoamide acyltransferase (E2) component
MRKTNTSPAYQCIPFPLERRLELDAAWIQRQKAPIFALTEMDVTEARQILRAHKLHSGACLSFTAFIVTCLARALDENKSLHAYRNWRNQLIIFDDVDVAVLIEIPLEDRKFPLLHVIRAANRKTVQEIHVEIRAVQADPTRSPSFSRQSQRVMRYFLVLPGFLRRLIYRLLLGNPHWFRQVAGTVAVTAVGMFGKGAGWGINISGHSLSVTVGGIARKPGIVDEQIEIRESLNLTISFDHIVTDGAPAARFVQRLKELVEGGYGLPV